MSLVILLLRGEICLVWVETGTVVVRVEPWPWAHRKRLFHESAALHVQHGKAGTWEASDARDFHPCELLSLFRNSPQLSDSNEPRLPSSIHPHLPSPSTDFTSPLAYISAHFPLSVELFSTSPSSRLAVKMLSSIRVVSSRTPSSVLRLAATPRASSTWSNVPQGPPVSYLASPLVTSAVSNL